MTHSEQQPNLIECLYPILDVTSLQTSLSYYVNVLGFREDWSTGTLAQVSREGFGIMLNERTSAHPQEIWPQEIWIGVERLEPFYEEFVGNGAQIAQEPANHPWAYDMKVQDPDGHLLWIGAGPKSDEPFVE